MRTYVLLLTAVTLSTAATYAQTALPAVAFAAQPLPVNVETPITADFNGNGKLDIASISGVDILVSLGNGDGTFGPPSSYTISSSTVCGPSSLLTGDFNGDGKVDLVAIPDGGCNQLAAGVYVLLGNGDGTFQAAKRAAYNSTYLYAAATGDFNHDGKLDVALSSYAGNPSLTVLLGNGDGTFTNGAIIATSSQMQQVYAADLNADGKLDLLSSNDEGSINAVLGNGDGTFQAPIATAGSFVNSSIADYNGDGKLDIAYYPNQPDTIYILLGKGDGTFNPPVSVNVPHLIQNPPIAGDFNGDGKIDLAVTVFSQSTAGTHGFGGSTRYDSLAILPGKGDGTFGPAQPAGLAVAQPALAADFNGDGLLDLAGAGFIFLQTTVLPSPIGVFFPPTLTGKTSASKAVTVHNIGGAALHISQLGFTGPAAPDFALTNSTCIASPIAPAGTCTVDVSFTPSAPGERLADLTITDDAVGSPQLAALIGAATPLHVIPASLNFGTVKVGTPSPDLVLRVTNTSTSIVKIKNIAITGPDKGDYIQDNSCGTSIRPHATCSIIVQFVPTRKGVRNAGISITQSSTFDASPKTAPLTGTGN